MTCWINWLVYLCDLSILFKFRNMKRIIISDSCIELWKIKSFKVWLLLIVSVLSVFSSDFECFVCNIECFARDFECFECVFECLSVFCLRVFSSVFNIMFTSVSKCFRRLGVFLSIFECFRVFPRVF